MTPTLFAERAVLGCVMLRPETWPPVNAALKAVDFDLPAHREIFAAMQAVTERGAPADMILVEEEMRLGKTLPGLEGGAAYLLALMDAQITTATLPHYIAAMARASAIRGIQVKAALLADRAETEPDEAQRLILEIQRLLTESQAGRRAPGVTLAAAAAEAFGIIQTRVQQSATNTQAVVGVSTQLERVDVISGGLRDKTLNIVAAKTSIGKTAWACQIGLLGALNDGVACLYVSLEMSPAELAERFYARLGRVDSSHIRSGNIAMDDWRRIIAAGSTLFEPRPFVVTNTHLLSGILSEARAFRVQNPGRMLVVVDYLQKVILGERGRTREQEVAAVSSTLKQLAMELDCPVLAPVQFNRAADHEDRPPRLSDIRESGSIEQDADMIIFLDRQREAPEGAVEILVAKNRNGQCGKTSARWTGRFYEFADMTGGVPQAKSWDALDCEVPQ